MSFILNYLRGEQDVIQETFSFPGDAGLQVAFSRFAGYSPALYGGIRCNTAASISSEKSSDIVVTIIGRASHQSCKSNIRIHQLNNSLTISTGGLSAASLLTIPWLSIGVAISFPSTIGPFSLDSPSLPIYVYSIPRAGDVVIKTSSSAISVSAIEARSLTVSSQSGRIEFEDGSEQIVDRFIDIRNSSGATRISSLMTTPVVRVETSSGSTQLGIETTAGDISASGSSGGITGQVRYKRDGSTSRYTNSSGHLNVTLSGWSGFLTAKTSSGGCHVRGLERWNDGWRKGKGDARAVFETQSGALNVEAL